MILISEIWARFEQRLYFLNETDMHFEVCVLVDEIFVDNGISLLVMSLNNNSAEGIKSSLYFDLHW